jgi:hypothetical protein
MGTILDRMKFLRTLSTIGRERIPVEGNGRQAINPESGLGRTRRASFVMTALAIDPTALGRGFS